MEDPRHVIDYGKYVKPGSEDSLGAWIAFLAVYCGNLQEADYGEMIKGGFRLRNGVIAKHRGSFNHPYMGCVPLFDFNYPATEDFVQYKSYVNMCEIRQGEFLKELMLGKFPEDRWD